MPRKRTDMSVKTVESVDDKWSIKFSDGTLVHCAKAPLRNDTHVDALITSHGHSGINPIHTERMRAMIAAVREREAQL